MDHGFPGWLVDILYIQFSASQLEDGANVPTRGQPAVFGLKA
jgi:hypothetical protein